MTRTLVRGATVVTLDPLLGDIERGDVLIEGERIVRVGTDLDAAGAQVLDCSGMILIPGLVNAHMHTWQTALRSAASNWTLLEYFRNMHAGLATLFQPEDLYIGTLMGALNQINCGTTTLVDWCHNNPTPEHTDAAIQGLRHSGIRAAFFHGSPKPDAKPGQKPFWEIPHPRREVERLLGSWFTDRDAKVTLGLAILGPHYGNWEVTEHDFRMARELGLIASMHSAGPEPRTPDGWARLEAAGLLGDNINIVHGQNLSDEQLGRMIAQGVSFSVTPEGEMCQGHGFAITGRVRRYGGILSLGVDLESIFSGDMFTVARMALVSQRGLDNDASKRERGQIPETSTIYCREALEWATLGGARMLKMDDRIGSITPGKQADLVAIRADDLNMWPVHDPVSSVVMQTSVGNVDTVIVAGEIKKRGGRLLYSDLGRKKDALAASGRRIVGELRRARDLH